MLAIYSALMSINLLDNILINTNINIIKVDNDIGEYNIIKYDI